MNFPHQKSLCHKNNLIHIYINSHGKMFIVLSLQVFSFLSYPQRMLVLLEAPVSIPSTGGFQISYWRLKRGNFRVLGKSKILQGRAPFRSGDSNQIKEMGWGEKRRAK